MTDLWGTAVPAWLAGIGTVLATFTSVWFSKRAQKQANSRWEKEREESLERERRKRELTRAERAAAVSLTVNIASDIYGQTEENTWRPRIIYRVTVHNAGDLPIREVWLFTPTEAELPMTGHRQAFTSDHKRKGYWLQSLSPGHEVSLQIAFPLRMEVDGSMARFEPAFPFPERVFGLRFTDSDGDIWVAEEGDFPHSVDDSHPLVASKVYYSSPNITVPRQSLKNP